MKKYHLSTSSQDPWNQDEESDEEQCGETDFEVHGINDGGDKTITDKIVHSSIPINDSIGTVTVQEHETILHLGTANPIDHFDLPNQMGSWWLPAGSPRRWVSAILTVLSASLNVLYLLTWFMTITLMKLVNRLMMVEIVHNHTRRHMEYSPEMIDRLLVIDSPIELSNDVEIFDDGVAKNNTTDMQTHHDEKVGNTRPNSAADFSANELLDSYTDDDESSDVSKAAITMLASSLINDPSISLNNSLLILNNLTTRPITPFLHTSDERRRGAEPDDDEELVAIAAGLDSIVQLEEHKIESNNATEENSTDLIIIDGQ